MNKIIPAILPKDWTELEERVESVKNHVSTVQVDICDGRFVKNFSWPYRKHDQNFEEVQREEKGMPFWDEVDYEIDLMVENPEDIISEWIATGASNIIIHVESTKNLEKIVEEYSSMVGIGLALNIETPLDIVKPFISKISHIQLMGIDRIGFQGQDFDKAVFEKIKEIRDKYPDLSISVDGGVDLETAPKLLDAGVDILIVGSAIFQSQNIVDTIEQFKSI